ncbi:MAG: hypothetical protein AAB425_07330, partial [Bdellovibrionota bacterium]
EYDLFKEAEGFLRRFPGESTGTPDYLVMDLLVSNHFSPSDQTIVKARALLQQGVQEPLIYKILIQRSVDHGYKDNAENLVGEATKKWPDQAETFKKALLGTDGDNKKKKDPAKGAKPKAATLEAAPATPKTQK